MIVTHLRKKRFGFHKNVNSNVPIYYCGRVVRKFPTPCMVNFCDDYVTVQSIIPIL